jgi:hypothetical protein
VSWSTSSAGLLCLPALARQATVRETGWGRGKVRPVLTPPVLTAVNMAALRLPDHLLDHRHQGIQIERLDEITMGAEAPRLLPGFIQETRAR